MFGGRESEDIFRGGVICIQKIKTCLPEEMAATNAVKISPAVAMVFMINAKPEADIMYSMKMWHIVSKRRL